jgi:uncharacterized protein (TIGR02145 family)
MFLENTMGMAVSDQVITGTRASGTVGSKLKSGGASGFSGLLSGYGGYAPSFFKRPSFGYFLSSTESGASAVGRLMNTSNASLGRSLYDKAFSMSLRCIKD